MSLLKLKNEGLTFADLVANGEILGPEPNGPDGNSGINGIFEMF